jgi:hypothetical protein
MLIGLWLALAVWMTAPSSTIAPQFGAPVRIGYEAGSDRAPAMIADASGRLYVAFEHAGNAGNNRLFVQRSEDDGASWSAPIAVATSGGAGGFEPSLAVDSQDGTTLSLAFVRSGAQPALELTTSHDYGATWSQPRTIALNPAPPAKPVVVSRGSLMAVAFAGDGGRVAARVSADAGAHWTTRAVDMPAAPVRLLDAGGAIDAAGQIFFAWNAVTGRDRRSAVWVTRSTDRGATWKQTGLPTTAGSCSSCARAVAPLAALRVGSDDAVYVLWNAAAGRSLKERISFARSIDHGATFSAPKDLSDAPRGIPHSLAALVTGQAAGDVRVAWMDARTGRWNVYYRASGDGGATFGAATRLSEYVPGYPYFTHKGFYLPAGDTLQMAVDTAGITHVAFAAAQSDGRPANVFDVNEQPSRRHAWFGMP